MVWGIQDTSAAACPRPCIGSVHDGRRNRVALDTAAQGQQVRIPVDQDRREAALTQVAHQVMPAIELLRVDV